MRWICEDYDKIVAADKVQQHQLSMNFLREGSKLRWLWNILWQVPKDSRGFHGIVPVMHRMVSKTEQLLHRIYHGDHYGHVLKLIRPKLIKRLKEALLTLDEGICRKYYGRLQDGNLSWEGISDALKDEERRIVDDFVSGTKNKQTQSYAITKSLRETTNDLQGAGSGVRFSTDASCIKRIIHARATCNNKVHSLLEKLIENQDWNVLAIYLLQSVEFLEKVCKKSEIRRRIMLQPEPEVLQAASESLSSLGSIYFESYE